MTPAFKRFIDRWVPVLRNVTTWDLDDDYSQLEAIFGYPKSQLFSKLSINDVAGKIDDYVRKEKPSSWSRPCLRMFETLYANRKTSDSLQVEIIILWTLRGLVSIEKTDEINQLTQSYRLTPTFDEKNYKAWEWTAKQALEKVSGSQYGKGPLDRGYLPVIFEQYEMPQRLLLLTAVLMYEPGNVLLLEKCSNLIDWSNPTIEHWLTLSRMWAYLGEDVVKTWVPPDLCSTYGQSCSMISTLYDKCDPYTLIQKVNDLYVTDKASEQTLPYVDLMDSQELT